MGKQDDAGCQPVCFQAAFGVCIALFNSNFCIEVTQDIAELPYWQTFEKSKGRSFSMSQYVIANTYACVNILQMLKHMALIYEAHGANLSH